MGRLANDRLIIIGVLTKPDMAGGDAESEIWLNVINGKSHKLQHGYFMVRLPKDETEMQLSPTKARETEMNYLNGRWKGLGAGVDPNRMGIEKLSAELSIRLSIMISEMFNPWKSFNLIPRLPYLKKDLSEKMRGVRQGLDVLPRSFHDNPQLGLMSLCREFIKEVEKYTSGKPNDDPDQLTFLQDAAPYYKTLKEEVIDTRPQFEIIGVKPPSVFSSEPVTLSPAPPSHPTVKPVLPEASNRKAKSQGKDNPGVQPLIV